MHKLLLGTWSCVVSSLLVRWGLERDEDPRQPRWMACTVQPDTAACGKGNLLSDAPGPEEGEETEESTELEGAQWERAHGAG